jgi:tRNA(Ile)-lysidine synthase
MTRRTRRTRPSLRTLVRRFLTNDLTAEGKTILVAVSGGGDSQALLHVLAGLREECKFQLVACGVNHGLRLAAARELALAESTAQSYGVSFVTRHVQVASGGNLQARARAARRQALLEVQNDVAAAYVATAHHADDRAETFVMRLLRGTRLRGLGVLPPHEGVWIRPMIAATKHDVREHLLRARVPHAEDPSNADPRFLRTRVRHEIMPLLAQLNPGVVSHLSALAEEASRGGGPQPGSRATAAEPEGTESGTSEESALASLAKGLLLGKRDLSMTLGFAAGGSGLGERSIKMKTVKKGSP